MVDLLDSKNICVENACRVGKGGKMASNFPINCVNCGHPSAGTSRRFSSPASLPHREREIEHSSQDDLSPPSGLGSEPMAISASADIGTSSDGVVTASSTANLVCESCNFMQLPDSIYDDVQGPTGLASNIAQDLPEEYHKNSSNESLTITHDETGGIFENNLKAVRYSETTTRCQAGNSRNGVEGKAYNTEVPVKQTEHFPLRSNIAGSTPRSKAQKRVAFAGLPPFTDDEPPRLSHAKKRGGLFRSSEMTSLRGTSGLDPNSLNAQINQILREREETRRAPSTPSPSRRLIKNRSEPKSFRSFISNAVLSLSPKKRKRGSRLKRSSLGNSSLKCSDHKNSPLLGSPLATSEAIDYESDNVIERTRRRAAESRNLRNKKKCHRLTGDGMTPKKPSAAELEVLANEEDCDDSSDGLTPSDRWFRPSTKRSSRFSTLFFPGRSSSLSTASSKRRSREIQPHQLFDNESDGFREELSQLDSFPASQVPVYFDHSGNEGSTSSKHQTLNQTPVLYDSEDAAQYSTVRESHCFPLPTSHECEATLPAINSPATVSDINTNLEKDVGGDIQGQVSRQALHNTATTLSQCQATNPSGPRVSRFKRLAKLIPSFHLSTILRSKKRLSYDQSEGGNEIDAENEKEKIPRFRLKRRSMGMFGNRLGMVPADEGVNITAQEPKIAEDGFKVGPEFAVGPKPKPQSAERLRCPRATLEFAPAPLSAHPTNLGVVATTPTYVDGKFYGLGPSEAYPSTTESETQFLGGLSSPTAASPAMEPMRVAVQSRDTVRPPVPRLNSPFQPAGPSERRIQKRLNVAPMAAAPGMLEPTTGGDLARAIPPNRMLFTTSNAEQHVPLIPVRNQVNARTPPRFVHSVGRYVSTPRRSPLNSGTTSYYSTGGRSVSNMHSAVAQNSGNDADTTSLVQGVGLEDPFTTPSVMNGFHTFHGSQKPHDDHRWGDSFS